MSFNIKFSSQATKFIRKLEKKLKERIKNKFLEFSKNPFQFLEHYEGEGYKFRIGNYRALIDVDISNKNIFVRVFDKRGRIYKK